MKTIPLTQGKIALVDDEDYERVSMYRWHAYRNRNTWYVSTNIRQADGGWTRLKMHRLIIDAVLGEIVDHRDGDGLNNQRSNLRCVSTSQNSQNKRTPRHNQSGYKGVHRENTTKPRQWIASITMDGKQTKIGRYLTAEDAARAYNEAALQHFGEHARLNVVADITHPA